MRLSIDAALLQRLGRELQRARGRETGGVLVAANRDGETFDLLEFSVQEGGGGRMHFQRDPVQARHFIGEAITRAGGDPTRTNYLGEWHSHVGAPAFPSDTDVWQMQTLVEQEGESAGFAVLLVVVQRNSRLELSLTLFRAGQPPQSVELEVRAELVPETGPNAAPPDIPPLIAVRDSHAGQLKPEK